MMLGIVACGDDTESSSSVLQSDSLSSSESENESAEPTWQSDASEETVAKVEKLLESKHRLTYNDDGSFRVMIVADAHVVMTASALDKGEIKGRIQKIIEKIQPNLVILTGDNTRGSAQEGILRRNITTIVGAIEEAKIPWCHVYGNHDHENALTREEQQLIYESYEWCISKDVEELSGTGNYVHGVYNKDGSLGSLIWLMDSGAYVQNGEPGYYDYIKQDQIDWYKETSLLVKEYNNGETVKGMMAFHIPLLENDAANASKDNEAFVFEAAGGVNEPMHTSLVDTNLLETIWELADVKAIVTGHDHKNDYMFNYKGVKLCASPTLSDIGYHDETTQGARIFDLAESTLDNIPTHVEYVIQK